MKKRLFPLIAGIFIGLVVSVGTSVQALRSSGLLANGLYNTAVKSLLPSINQQVFIMCISCYAIWASLVVRSKLNGWTRRLPELVIIIGLLAPLNVFFSHKVSLVMIFIRRNLTSLSLDVLRDMCLDGGIQVIAAVLVVAVGLFLLRKMHRNTVKSSTLPSVEVTRRMSSAIEMGISRLIRSAQFISQGNWGVYLIILIVFVGLNLASFGFDIMNAHANRNRPNIILIQIDTLRPDHLGCYGYKRRTSPNIDKLASESMRFEKAIAAAPWTSASMAQYMTGRYLKDIDLEASGFPDGSCSGIPGNIVSIAEMLKDHGYSTAGVNSNLLAGAQLGFARGFDSWDQNSVNAEISSPQVFSSAVNNLKALKDRKFFMFLLFMDLHSPYKLHKEHNFYPDYKGNIGKKYAVSSNSLSNNISKDDMEYVKAIYDSEITYTDGYIGRLMDELKRMNLYNDTLIVLLSDHGEEFGEHGRMSHGMDLYDETLSVPLIIKLPGQKKGCTVGGVSSLVNLFSSIMDAVNIDSSSFHLNRHTAHLQDLIRTRDQDIYSSTQLNEADKECIRAKSYKLIVDKKSSKRELYSLNRDPAEKENILKPQPLLANDLSNRLKDVDGVSAKTDRGNLGKAAPSAEDVDKLKSLGYL